MTRSLLSSLVTGAVVAAGALSPFAATATAQGAAPRTTIVNCTGHEIVAPHEYVLACGDGNTALTHLRWSHWGERTATATGTEELNLCVPDCVDGKVASFPVTVTAQRRRDHRYQEVVVTAGSRRPKGVNRVERWYPIKPGQ